jgi:hypothetical protein
LNWISDAGAPTVPGSTQNFQSFSCQRNLTRFIDNFCDWQNDGREEGDQPLFVAVESDIFQCDDRSGAQKKLLPYNNWLKICWSSIDQDHNYFEYQEGGTEYLGTRKPIKLTNFTEAAFLKPLIYIVSQQAFFEKTSVEGLVYQADLQVSHGSIPYQLAIVILFLPIIWALGLSFSPNDWTGTLDAFTMLKLGGDWGEETRQLDMSSCSKVRADLAGIPGKVFVEPEEGTVRLKRVVNKHEPKGK